MKSQAGDVVEFSEEVVAFEELIADGLASENWGPFSDWEYKYSTQCGKVAHEEDPPFSPEIFDRVIKLFGDTVFLRSPGSSHVLKILEDEWGRLSTEQTDLLLPTLVDYYNKFADSLSKFLIAELLGQCYADVRALESLIALRSRETGDRELLKMGFKCLMRDARDESLRRRAMSEYLSM